jgi:hypothetical protein
MGLYNLAFLSTDMLFYAILLGGLLGGVLCCLFSTYKSEREQMLWGCYKGILLGGVLGGANVAFFILLYSQMVLYSYLWHIIGLSTMLLSGLVCVFWERQKREKHNIKNAITNKIF